MSATVRIDLYSEPDYNPKDVWYRRDSAYTYLYPGDLDGFVEVLDSICRGGELIEGDSEQVWDFYDMSPEVLASALKEAGMGDVLPELPEGVFTDFTVDVMY